MIHRTDDNQLELIQYLRSIVGNHRVKILSQVDNFFDAVFTWKGENIFLEFKSKKGKLSPGQNILHQTWGGKKFIVRTKDDIDEALGIR